MKHVIRFVGRLVLNFVVRLFYKRYPSGFSKLYLLRLAFFQRIVGFNRLVPWPVYPTSYIQSWRQITIPDNAAPGLSPGCYIQGPNGIIFGKNVLVGPNVAIISADHDVSDFALHTKAEPVRIGDNVWIGANCVILPGVQIGSNVVVGAGSVVDKDLPDNCVAAGNPCRVIRSK